MAKGVAALARNIRPGVHVSVAVFSSPTAVDTVPQEWVSQVDGGVVDTTATMTYVTDFTVSRNYVTSQPGSIEDYGKLLTEIEA